MNPQDNSTTSFSIGLPVEPLKWHPQGNAPAKIQALINPETDLPAGVTFKPALRVTQFEVAFQKFIVIILGCLLAGVTYIIVNSSNKPAWWVQALVIGISLLFVLVALRSLKNKVKYYKSCQTLLNQGKYRCGLYIMKDALMIHFNEQLYLAPKRQIKRFNAMFRGRSQGRSLEVLLVGKNGKNWVLNLDFLKLNNVIMQKELTAWLMAGRHMENHHN